MPNSFPLSLATIQFVRVNVFNFIDSLAKQAETFSQTTQLHAHASTLEVQ